MILWLQWWIWDEVFGKSIENIHDYKVEKSNYTKKTSWYLIGRNFYGEHWNLAVLWTKWIIWLLFWFTPSTLSWIYSRIIWIYCCFLTTKSICTKLHSCLKPSTNYPIILQWGLQKQPVVDYRVLRQIVINHNYMAIWQLNIKN